VPKKTPLAEPILPFLFSPLTLIRQRQFLHKMNDVPNDAKARRENAETHTASLGPVAAAALAAIQNDMDQARELAAVYQKELAGKSNELAALKQLFERTREHLIQLQLSLTKLREDRHRLANESMRADALQRKLEKMTIERDILQRKLDSRIWGEGN
jgi:hypothetical protein